MEEVLPLEERCSDTSVGNTEGVNGGPRIKNQLNGKDVRVCVSAAWISKNLPACLGPSFVIGIIVFIWCVLAFFVAGYYTRAGTSNNNTSTAGSISACSPVSYTGAVCRPHLEMLQSCLSDRSTSSDLEIYVSSTSGQLEQQAQQLLLGLQLLNPTPECREAVEPFLCLYVFGLCDSSGELYLPSSGECETLTTETCAREWTMAQSLLSSDQLPQCDTLPVTSVVCNGTVTATTNSSEKGNILCADQFYLDEEVGLCLPDCRRFSLFSDGGQMAATGIIISASILGVVGGIMVLALSCVNYKKVFAFPVVLIRYITAVLLLYIIVVLIGYVDQEFFYCKSRSLMESLMYPTAFCTFTGIIYYYIFWQSVIWWLCHVAVMLWGLKFPFQARRFKVAGKTKYLHTTVLVLGLLLPIIPVAAALGTGGFTLARLPPNRCDARNSNATFYASAGPIGCMIATGITLLVLLFWTIFKEHKAMKEQRRLPEVKVLIIICYFATLAVFAMVTNAVTFRIGYSNFQEAFVSYLLCEATGIQTNSTMACDRTELNRAIPIQALVDTLYVLYVIIPAVNLVYAFNTTDMKALKERCMKCCPGWCKKTARGKKKLRGLNQAGHVREYLIEPLVSL